MLCSTHLSAATETTPLDRLRAFGLAYVRFALEHPEHYRLAMLEPCPKPNVEVDEVLHSSAFSHMQTTVEECIAAGVFEGDPLAITFEMAAPGLDGSLTTEWSTVVYQFDGNYFSGVYVYGTDKAQVQQLGSKLAANAAHHLAEASAGKPGTGGGPFTSQAIPQDSGAQA